MRRMIGLACLLALFAAYPVLAHSELIDAQPAPGARLAESPAEIQLTFSEPVAADSRIVVLGEGFQALDGVDAVVDSANPAVARAALPALEPGTYTVQWTASSADGHEVSGSYSFSVTSTAGGASGGDTAAVGNRASMSRLIPWIALVAFGVAILAVLYRRLGR